MSYRNHTTYSEEVTFYHRQRSKNGSQHRHESINVAKRIKVSAENAMKQKELADIIFNYSDEAAVAIWRNIAECTVYCRLDR